VVALTLVLNTVEVDANNLGHDTNEGLSNEIFDASLTATTARDANKEDGGSAKEQTKAYQPSAAGREEEFGEDDEDDELAGLGRGGGLIRRIPNPIRRRRSSRSVCWKRSHTGYADVASLGNVGGVAACKAHCLSAKYANRCKGISTRNSDKHCWLEGAPRAGDLPGSSYTTMMIDTCKSTKSTDLLFLAAKRRRAAKAKCGTNTNIPMPVCNCGKTGKPQGVMTNQGAPCENSCYKAVGRFTQVGGLGCAFTIEPQWRWCNGNTLCVRWQAWEMSWNRLTLFPLFASKGVGSTTVVDPNKPTEICKKFDMNKCWPQRLIIERFEQLCDMLPAKGCSSGGTGAWQSFIKQCKEKWIPAIKGIKKVGGNIFAAGRRRGLTNELNPIGTVNDFVSPMWFPKGRKAEGKGGSSSSKKGKATDHCFRHVSTAKTGKPKGQPMCGICKPRWSTCNVGGFKGLYGQYPKGRKSCTFADAWRDGARCYGVSAGKTSTECKSGYCFSNGRKGGICAMSNGKLKNGWKCWHSADCASHWCGKNSRCKPKARDGARCGGISKFRTSTECKSGYCFQGRGSGGICARSNGKLDNGWGCRWAHDCKSGRCPGGGIYGGRRLLGQPVGSSPEDAGDNGSMALVADAGDEEEAGTNSDQPSDGGKARIGGKGPDSGQVGEGAGFWRRRRRSARRRRTRKSRVCY